MPHVFFEYNELRWEMVIPFVDIDGTVDHHWFKLSFNNILIILEKTILVKIKI
jgi:hypothetical protein